jgi:hypothetical protein
LRQVEKDYAHLTLGEGENVRAVEKRNCMIRRATRVDNQVMASFDTAGDKGHPTHEKRVALHSTLNCNRGIQSCNDSNRHRCELTHLDELKSCRKDRRKGATCQRLVESIPSSGDAAKG